MFICCSSVCFDAWWTAATYAESTWCNWNAAVVLHHRRFGLSKAFFGVARDNISVGYSNTLIFSMILTKSSSAPMMSCSTKAILYFSVTSGYCSVIASLVFTFQSLDGHYFFVLKSREATSWEANARAVIFYIMPMWLLPLIFLLCLAGHRSHDSCGHLHHTWWLNHHWGLLHHHWRLLNHHWWLLNVHWWGLLLIHF